MAGADLNFLNIVKDLEINEAAWLWDEMKLTMPEKLYVIIFTARSGSSWLTNVLSETRQLGFPEEYINPNFVRGVAGAVNATVPEKFLGGLQRRRKSPNGVFGIEAREVDVKLFGADSFFRAFGNGTVFFNLWRENLVAQAVSLFRAVETQHFHAKQGEETAQPPGYNAEAVGKWLIHLASQENANVNMLAQRRLPFINLCYEQMVANREQTLRLFARALGIELTAETLAAKAKEPLRKIGDDWNDDTERRFRTEAEAMVAKIEADRQIKHYILKRINGVMIRPGPASASIAKPAGEAVVKSALG
jgi:LPS sulfotransferase NodH